MGFEAWDTSHFIHTSLQRGDAVRRKGGRSVTSQKRGVNEISHPPATRRLV